MPVRAFREIAAGDFFGLRVNVWVSIVVGIGGVFYLVVSRRRFPRREAPDTVQGLTGGTRTDAEDAA